MVLPAPILVTSTADSGAHTLRQAIITANSSSGLQTIDFKMSGTGVHTIKLGSALPTITNSVIIDGTSQTGYTNRPLIEINGANAGNNVDGLYITAGGCTIQGLDIDKFLGTGIVLQTGGNNLIEANYIGTDPTGTVAKGNRDTGLLIFNGSANNRIIQNVISANGSTNGDAGVYVSDAGTNGNVFQGNFVGTDKTGTVALGNGGVGIYLANGAQNTLIGTNGDGINDIAERNIISGNGYQGIAIQGTSSGANTTGTVVAGNYVGTNAAGTGALANGNNGVYILAGASNNRIGTNGTDVDAAAEGNLISGNTFDGVAISDSGTSSNTVAGNLIGTDVTGTIAVPNADGGIDIFNGATSNTIGYDGSSSGAVAALERNIISGNGATPGFAGVFISDSGTNLNVIAGNYVGVDISGTKPLGNTGVGVYLANGASNNRIGTDGNGVGDTFETNVLSANAYQGVAIQGTASGTDTDGNIVAGNLIGTDRTGTLLLGNGNNGVLIFAGAQSNRIGTNGTDSDFAAEGNVIAGNSLSGVVVSDPSTNLNLVAGNWIGTDKSATLSLPNGEWGVSIHAGAQNNQIGGSAVLGNVIAFNTQAGVSVVDSTSTGNSIEANSIFSNGGLGIDLGDSGVQVNHAGSTSGPNNLQNYPLITSAKPGASTVIGGSLNSLPSATYTLDFYANNAPDITFYGPGQFYLGSTTVTTDGSGNANFSVTLSAATTANQWVTATATDSSGDTSEFSGARQLPFTATVLSRTTWTSMGPSPIAQSPEYTGPVMSGRVETAAPDPTNPNVMYITSDGGGVWKTTNWLSVSPNWIPLTDGRKSTVTGSGDLAYTSLAVFPGNPNIIYATAQGPGGGIMKSTDGGASWTFLANSVFDQVSFSSLVLDPTNSNILYVGVWYGPSANSGGIYKSTDGGVTWTNLTSSFFTGAGSDIVMDPTNSSILYAGLTQGANGGSGNGLYKSTDGGATWTLLSGGLLTGSAVGVTIRVAVAPSAPQTLYATVFDPALGNAPQGLPHRFQSTDGGNTWTSLPGLPTNEESRYWHVMLSVDPANPQTIYVNGDHTVYESNDGGSTWNLINNSEDPVGGFFDDSGGLILVGDHGIYSGTNFVNKQGNLGTSEFYTLTLDPTNPNVMYGLAQDQFAANKYNGYPVWNSTEQVPNGQDGGGAGETGKILVDPTSPNQLYRYAPTDTDSFILVSTDGGASWSESGTGIPTALAGYNLAYASEKAFVLDPTNSQRVLVGTNQVYETTDSATTWNAISPVLSPSSNVNDQYITALAIAPSNPNTVYAATADGRVFVTQNDGGSWTEVDTGLPVDSADAMVSIQVDPNNSNRVFMTTGMFPTSVFGSAHVYMTTTGGASGWSDISGNLNPEYWTNSIAVDWRPATPVLYLATARGVYQSADLGVDWSRFGLALPNSPVSDLQIDTTHNILAAATYGRGVWEMKIGAINHVWTGQGASNNWSDPNNWSGHVLPAAGDNLIFGAGASRLTNTNNLAAGTLYDIISFTSSGYSISGNAIKISGFVDASHATGNNTFNLAMTETGPTVLITGAASTDLTLGGAIADGGFPLVVVGGSGRVDLKGAISGTGGLIVHDSGGTLAMSGSADTYSGVTSVQGGTLLLGKSGTAVAGTLVVSGGTVRLSAINEIAAASAVTVNIGSFLDLNGNSNTIGFLTLNGGSVVTGTGTLTLGSNVSVTGTSSISGNLALGPATRTITVNAASTLTISAVISGASGLTKVGAGTLILSGTNTYTGTTTVNAGTLLVNGTQTSSAISIGSSGTLGGTGTVGSITAVSGGQLSPGINSGQTGTLTATSVTLPSGSTFNVQANGTGAGSGYSQLVTSGTVNLTGSTLNFTLGFTPSIGAVFTMIHSTGGPIIGTFKNLPQNATFVVNGMTFQINYSGGAGNDVVVTRIA
jgi:titin